MAAALAIATAGTAHATWSVIVADTRTGEVGIASATCLTSFDLRDWSPVVIPGVGAAATQSSPDSTGQNRVKVRDMLMAGAEPDEILAALAGFDSNHQSRQYGILDAEGRSATFSGTKVRGWAGSRTGRVGDLAYTVQGNSLTGESVLTAAEQALVSEPGSLPEKLLAAMEAARAMGGDGRCSCPNGGPTGCGSPPRSFSKSAHAAFLIVARSGDVPGCNGIMRAGEHPSDVALGDFNGDGRTDVSVGSAGSTLVMTGVRQAGDAFVALSDPADVEATADTRRVVVADVTGEGVDDLVFAAYGADTVGVQAGNGDGTFGPPVRTAAGDGPVGVTAGDLNGDDHIDVAVANRDSGDVSVFLNEAGGLAGQQRYATGDAPAAIAAGDLDGDGDSDLAVLATGPRTVDVLRNDGAGAYSLAARVEAGVDPTDLCIVDVDADNDLDLVAADRGSGSLHLLANGGGADFTPRDVVVPEAVTIVRAGDVNADSKPDLVVTGGSSRRAWVLAGDGAGGFSVTGSFSVNDDLLDLELADLNVDGTLDAVGAGGGLESIVVVESVAPGLWNDGMGCATGDYFLNLDVAGATAADPDPVYTLGTMFAARLADIAGHPDAVASRVRFGALGPAERRQVAMTIELRDWQGRPVDAVSAAVSVRHAPDSAGLAAIGEAVSTGSGTFRLVLEVPPNGTGEDRFVVVADDGVRAVTLMPNPRLRTSTSHPRPHPLLRKPVGT